MTTLSTRILLIWMQHSTPACMMQDTVMTHCCVNASPQPLRQIGGLNSAGTYQVLKRTRRVEPLLQLWHASISWSQSECC
jgi:hypothetical protein